MIGEKKFFSDFFMPERNNLTQPIVLLPSLILNKAYSMTHQNDSASPLIAAIGNLDFGGNEVFYENYGRGLTKREHFAAMAMQAILSKPNRELEYTSIAMLSVEMADKLIKALNVQD